MADNYTPKSEWEQQYEREYKRIMQAIRRQTKLGYHVPESVKPTPPSKVKAFSSTQVKRLEQLTPKEIRKHSAWVDTGTGEAYPGLDVVNSNHKAKPSVANIDPNRKKREKSKTAKIEYENTPTNKEKKKVKNKQNTKTDKGEKKGTKKKQREESAPPQENSLNMQIISGITGILEDWKPATYWPTSFAERKATYRCTIYDKWMQAIETEGAFELAFRLENKAEMYHRMIDRVIYFSDSVSEDLMNLNEIITFLTGAKLTAEESDKYASEAYDYLRDNFIGNSYG